MMYKLIVLVIFFTAFAKESIPKHKGKLEFEADNFEIVPNKATGEEQRILKGNVIIKQDGLVLKSDKFVLYYKNKKILYYEAFGKVHIQNKTNLDRIVNIYSDKVKYLKDLEQFIFSKEKNNVKVVLNKQELVAPKVIYFANTKNIEIEKVQELNFSPKVSEDGGSLPIQLTADKALYKGENINSIYFSGNVTADNLNIKMTSDKLRLDLNDKQEVEYMLAEENVVISRDNFTSTSQKAHFDVVEKTIELSGSPSPKAIQSGNEIIADKITYNIKEDVVSASKITGVLE